MTRDWALSADLSGPVAALAVLLGLLSLLLLVLELRREGWRRSGAWAVVASGIAALCCLLGAVLRPVWVKTKGASLGPRVVVLVDASRSIDLPADGGGSRREAVGQSLGLLAEHLQSVRLRVLGFGHGPPRALGQHGGPPWGPSAVFDERPQPSSDLTAAIEAVASGTEELPQALVVVSDGRLDRPTAMRLGEQLDRAAGRLEVPIHTVAVARTEPADASVRWVDMPEAVVAHQPFPLTVEVGCAGELSCADPSGVAVVVRELFERGRAVVRASGRAKVEQGSGTVELTVVLDRAGQRIVEVSIEAPEGDAIAENDRRLLPVNVARDRVRLLHIAGRPTYDVRALRTWLKSDASVDVVAFFILRSPSDNVVAPTQELALIPFPVDELFTVHLASFDAVILQDFDALPYELSRHLPALASYVRRGGGLIMVGGPHAFVSGHYAHTPLAGVLPVDLDSVDAKRPVDHAPFAPLVTEAGRWAPVLDPLRAVVGMALPEMPGANVVGDARSGATVLWVHPARRTASGAAMPVLALGEYGSGRSIALTVDGSHRLKFSEFAASTAGRAHGALWDALLGWLMRDPRFEPARVELPEGCVAGLPTELVVQAATGGAAAARVTVARMGSGEVVRELRAELGAGRRPTAIDVGRLAPGGYVATVELERTVPSAPSRYDFACEVGGDEWADPRPDPERLAAIADATGGTAVGLGEVDAIAIPEGAEVVAARYVRPVRPPWFWTSTAALLLGVHWLLRRRWGLH